MPLPFLAQLALALAPSIAGGIFGGNKNRNQQTTETVTEQTDPRYKSPTLGALDPFVLKMLIGNLGSFSKAGMPGGADRFGMGDWSKQLIAMLDSQYPKILGALGGGGGNRMSDRQARDPREEEERRRKDGFGGNREI